MRAAPTLEFYIDARVTEPLALIAEKFAERDPFRHVVIDDFFSGRSALYAGRLGRLRYLMKSVRARLRR